MFRDDERLLDEEDVARLPELLFDLDTPDEDRVEEPELLTADEPPDRLEDDLLTPDDLDDLLPAADFNAEDAALPNPRRITLPAEFERESDILDIVRTGEAVGRKLLVSIRSVAGGVILLGFIVCELLPADTDDRSASLPVTTRPVLFLSADVPLLMMALLPLPLIILDRASERISLLVSGWMAAAC